MNERKLSEKLLQLNAEQLNELDAKLSKLSELVQQAFVDGSEYRTILTEEEFDTIQAANILFSQLKSGISHTRDIKQQTGKDTERQHALNEAIQLAKTTFPVKENDCLNVAKVTLALCSCVSELHSSNTYQDLVTQLYADIEKEMHAEALLEFMNTQYTQNIAQLAAEFLAINGTFINNRYVQDWTLRVRKRLDNPAEEDRQLLNALSTFISKSIS